MGSQNAPAAAFLSNERTSGVDGDDEEEDYSYSKRRHSEAKGGRRKKARRDGDDDIKTSIERGRLWGDD
jgi:hypothetical protein